MFEWQEKLQKVRNRGKKTKKVTLGKDEEALDIVLSLVSTKEEMGVNEYAAEYTGLSQLQAIKIAILSYAIRGIAGVDLSDKPYVETGGFSKEGKAIKKERHAFIRDIIESWTPVAIDELFKEYAAMIEVSAEDAFNVVKILSSTLMKTIVEDSGLVNEEDQEKLEALLEEELNSPDGEVVVPAPVPEEEVVPAPPPQPQPVAEKQEAEPAPKPPMPTAEDKTKKWAAGFVPPKTYVRSGPENDQEES